MNNITKVPISNILPKVFKVDHMITYKYKNSTQYNQPVQLVHNSMTVPINNISPGASWTNHTTTYKINIHTHTHKSMTCTGSILRNQVHAWSRNQLYSMYCGATLSTSEHTDLTTTHHTTFPHSCDIDFLHYSTKAKGRRIKIQLWNGIKRQAIFTVS